MHQAWCRRLNKCSKIDVCKCSTDEGIIDLWSLAGLRFQSIKGLEKFDYHVYWNPCNQWTQESFPQTTKSNNCNDIAVCYDEAKILFIDIGEQETADFSFNATSGTCVLSLKGKAFPGGNLPSSSTHIILQCDPDEEGRLESVALLVLMRITIFKCS
ncbi:hypothetical protein OS493_023497 [Desmophyllum pertusum]|uniref:Uncharacterized protein n=1 Tax=Desmophyllum pertusum TaxID=174260 RepID=A0A9W9ZLZ4_9CNID|nr:hypothetical protein OS493_023497 [Desmophyllum pertusum]